MNQDAVKHLLLDLKSDIPDFQLIFSGKGSRKVNGLYKPDSMEIIIHNRNFSNDNELIYTAIHEFVHHIQFCDSKKNFTKYVRAHGTDFYAMFYQYLEKAEELGHYRAEFTNDQELTQLTAAIQNDYIIPSGKIMKEMGALLLKAQDICKKKGIRYEDYLDRVLNLPRTSASLIVKSAAFNLSEDLGYERMKVVANLNDPLKRESASKRMLDNQPIEKVKHDIKPQKIEEPQERLEKEKERVERSIERLTIYLHQVTEQLELLNKKRF